MTTTKARLEAGRRKFSRADVQELLAEIARLERENAALNTMIDRERDLVTELSVMVARLERDLGIKSSE